MDFNILVINPGAGSTKIAVFHNESMAFEHTIRHPAEELLHFSRIIDQYGYRKEKILETLEQHKVLLTDLQAVVGRGGPFKPLKSGTYEVNDVLMHDIETGNYQSEHPSLLGALIAREIADTVGVKAYFVDPVSVDEFWDNARYSGLKEIPRKALSHALNIRMVAKKTARILKKPFEKCKFIVAIFYWSSPNDIEQRISTEDNSYLHRFIILFILCVHHPNMLGWDNKYPSFSRVSNHNSINTGVAFFLSSVFGHY